MTNSINIRHWTRLAEIAEQAGAGSNTIDVYRRYCEASSSGNVPPSYTLLVGKPDAGIEIFLARWILPDAADALKSAGGAPLVIGSETGAIVPRLGKWHHFRANPGVQCAGDFVCLRTDQPLSSLLLAEIANVGFPIQCIFISSLRQPMHQTEREIIKSLSQTAPAGRVLFVGLAGEEPTDQDIAEVTALGARELRNSGFTDARSWGVSVWMTGGISQRAGVIANPSSFFAVDMISANAATKKMLESAFVHNLKTLFHSSDKQDAPSLLHISPDECDRVNRELATYLTSLGSEAVRHLSSRKETTAEELRRFVIQSIHNWGSYTTIEGSWLRYVEKMRPGLQTALMETVEKAASLLETRTETDNECADPSQPKPAMNLQQRLEAMAKHVFIGLGAGIIGYAIVSAFLRGSFGFQIVPGMPSILITIISSLAFLASGYLAFLSAPKIVPKIGARPIINSLGRQKTVLLGWTGFERDVLSWFAQAFKNQPPTTRERCLDLASQMQIDINAL